MSASERPAGELVPRAGVRSAPKRVIEVARFWRVTVAVLAVAVLLGAGRLLPWLLMPLRLAAMLGLAYANGANDVSKGIATLVGAGVTDYWGPKVAKGAKTAK